MTGPDPTPPGQSPKPLGSGVGPPRYVDREAAAGPTRRDRVQPSPLEIRAGVALILGLALLALLVGAIWELIAPRLEFEVVAKGSAYQSDIESEALIAADGWFAIIGAALGLGSGIAVWFWRRVRGPFMLLALAGGSLLGAYLAWKFGALLGRHPTASEARELLNHVGAQLSQRLDLRTHVVLLFQPAAAVLGYLLCVGISGRDDLGPGPKHDDAVEQQGVERVESRP